MKFLKALFYFLISAAIVISAVGFALPSSYEVSRSIIVQAQAEEVFKHIGVLRQWPLWTAWTIERYPDMQMTFSEPDVGVGATFSWSGETSGSGTVEITSSDPAKGIEYQLDFNEGTYVSHGSIFMTPVHEGLRVTWTNAGDLGDNPLRKYYGLMMDAIMGPDFERGLANLKATVELPQA